MVRLGHSARLASLVFARERLWRRRQPRFGLWHCSGATRIVSRLFAVHDGRLRHDCVRLLQPVLLQGNWARITGLEQSEGNQLLLSSTIVFLSVSKYRAFIYHTNLPSSIHWFLSAVYWKLKKKWKLHYINIRRKFILSPQEKRQGASVQSFIWKTTTRNWHAKYDHPF